MNRLHRRLNSFFISLAGAACALLIPGHAAAQSEDKPPVQHLSFDRPEAWALKYFTSATLLGGLQTPDRRKPGSVAVGLELGWLPELDPEQVRVGFSGRKDEDLNKAPIFMRPRVRVGLPWGFSLITAFTPPIRMFGVTPRLFAVGLERPIIEREAWSLGWRTYGQLGSVKGAFTCPERVLAFSPGSPGNPGRCVAESADSASLRYFGGDIQVARRISRLRGLTPHAAVGVNRIDGRFQVHAPTSTRLDQSRLRTRGTTFAGSAGLGYPISDRIALAVDVFYSPLWVRRVSDGPRTNEGLFNVRALLSYRLR